MSISSFADTVSRGSETLIIDALVSSTGTSQTARMQIFFEIREGLLDLNLGGQTRFIFDFRIRVVVLSDELPGGRDEVIVDQIGTYEGEHGFGTDFVYWEMASGTTVVTASDGTTESTDLELPSDWVRVK